MYDPLLLPELREMLIENDTRAMQEFCEVFHSGVVAENLEALAAPECWAVLSHTDLRRRVEIFEFLSLPRQMELVATLDKAHLSELLEEMSSDDRVALLKNLDPAQVELLMPLIAHAERGDIRKLLSYPEHSAGSIMTTDYASLPEGITAREALARLRTQAPDRETIYYVYVLDDARHLHGFVSLRKLFLARPDALVSELMDKDVISVRVDEDQEIVANKIARYDFIAMPVVDDQGRLVGIVTHDDVLDVVQQEATEDAHLMGAVAPLEDGYLATPFFTLAWKRGIWLVLLLVAGFGTSEVLSHYNKETERWEWLVWFLPLVLASGGNAGSQSATLVIRALALGQLDRETQLRIGRRELLTGLVLGGTMALLGFIFASFHVLKADAAVVAGTVALVVTLGTVNGTLLPIVLKRIGWDPALMSNPLIASLSDILGVLIYYNVALFALGKSLMFDPLLLPELREMLIENDAAAMREFCDVFHAGVVSENLEALPVNECWRVLSECGWRRRSEVFKFFSLPRQMELVAILDKPHLSALLEVMAPDDRVALLKNMDQAQVELLLPLVAQVERDDIRKLLSYPEHSAGSIMTTEYASLRRDVTAKEALLQLRLQAPDRELIYYVYVIDDGRKLQGFVSLRRLILAKPETPVSELMDEDVISVRVDEDQEVVANKIARYDFIAMPVVDDQNRLVGIVTHDDVLDVVQQEATEDVHRLGGMQPLTEHYLEANFVSLWWKRSIWLSALFVAEFFTFNALASYENEIEKIVALSLFVPLCLSTGGNSGSQAATLITRAMALGQVRLRDWLRVIRHELLMGLALGVTLGAIGFARTSLLTSESTLKGTNRWVLGAVIAQSVAAICLWGTLVGSALPLVFKRFGIDPGIASSPFVATFVDVTGIVIFFSIAKVYFNLG